MTILAIDTANATCSVTLRDTNGECISKRDDTPSKQAELLFPLINELFRENNIDYNALEALAVNIGPGSFTGIRIGMAAARGLALATKLPLIGVTTCEATACSAKKDSSYTNTPIMVVLDARRKQVYTQMLTHELTPINEAVLCTYEEIQQHTPKEPFYLAGSGIDLITTYLNTLSYKLASPIDPVNSESIAEVAAVKHSVLGDAHEMPVPLYIRKPDATPQPSKLILN